MVYGGHKDFRGDQRSGVRILRQADLSGGQLVLQRGYTGRSSADLVQQYDFSGKTIIPFNVHNGSRFSGTIETIQELEPDAEVVEDGFTINERDVPDAAGDVADWIEEIGYPCIWASTGT